MTVDAVQTIFRLYEVSNWGQLLEENSDTLYDSVQPAHCTECGEELGEFEPDARNIPCGSCGGTGMSLTEIILSGGA